MNSKLKAHRRHLLMMGAAIFLLFPGSSVLLHAAPEPFLFNLQKLTAADGVAEALFGWSVAVDGDTAVVGALSDDDLGRAYIFERNAGGANNWGHVKTVMASDGTVDNWFGFSAAISGDTIVVSSPSRGAAIFERNAGGANNWGEVKKLDPSQSVLFGYSVSIDTDTLIVGAPGSDSFPSLVFVFERNLGGPNNWGLAKTLMPSDQTQLNLFGEAVRLGGDVLVVGAPGAEVGASQNQGAAYIFARNHGGANNWGEVRKIVASDGAANDQLGCSVSIDGDTIVTGAKRHDVGANADQGAAYVFERNQGGADNWGETKKIISSEAASRDLFGSAVAISGNRVVVGLFSGRAYVFDRDLGAPGNWGEFQILGNGPKGSPFGASGASGASVAIDDATLLVGAPREQVGINNSQGAAFIFEPVPGPNPAIRGRTIMATQGAIIGGTIATVGDDTTPPGDLVATVISSPAGITPAFLLNENGRIGASVSVDCGVPVGTYSIGLQVADADGLTATGNATVIVTGNAGPILGTYPAGRAGLGGSVTISPSAPPTDDISVSSVTATAPGFTGTMTGNKTSGAVIISNAGPPGNYTVTVTATDSCGLTASRTFALTVLPELTTITVNTTADNTANDGACSLREAIVAANSNTASGALPGECVAGLSGTDTIAFNIPGAGPHTISPASALPAITEPVIIDGLTQSGANGTTWPPALKIIINGSNAGSSAHGLDFGGNAVFSTVRGLVINQFGQSGVNLQSNNNTIQCNFLGTDITGTARMGNGTGVRVYFSGLSLIGGTAFPGRNLISGNGTGIGLFGSDNHVEGNFIGTDVTGTVDLGNSGNGVRVAESGDPGASAPAGGFSHGEDKPNALLDPPNVIGGTTPGARNIISGNDQNGIYVTLLGAFFIAEGNFIGTDVTGTARLGNSANGVWIQFSPFQGLIIGGTSPASRNVISANGEAGVKIGGANQFGNAFASGNVVWGNYIGADVTGASNLGNAQDGVFLGHGASGNFVGSDFVATTANVIAFNARDGVRVDENATRNRISANSIFSNAGLGINLGSDGVTPNDAGDTDTGPNGLQNFPVLTSVITNGAITTVEGTFNAKPNLDYTLQLFSNAAANSSGNGQGQTWLGDQVIQTDSSGNVSFSVSLPTAIIPGKLITATAVLIGGSSDPDYGSTSEFSPTQVVEGIGVSPPSQLLNISTRLRVLNGENVLIGGFIITGTESKKVIIRGIGPSLAQFFNGTLDDPVLELYQGNTLIDGNNDWKTNEAAIAETGIPPSHDLESAIVRTLSPGAYTAILRSNTNTLGIGLVEAYDLDQAANSKLANISTRGFVDSGDNVMIGGFIIGGGDGGATVVVRAIGPALGNFGINGALQDPTLDLVDANGMVLRANNDWKDSQRTEIETAGLPPGDDRECALVQTLAPGNYTAIVRGAGNTTGVGLVEVYNIE